MDLESHSQQEPEIPASDSQETTDIAHQKLPFWIKVAYGSGGFGNNFIYALMTVYLMVFYTDYFGLPPAAVGTLFLVARIWDAINDPVMGMLVDNTETRWGKFRPYLLFVPFIVATTTTLCFTSPDFSPTGKLVFAYITYILWGMSFTAIDIPYWSMSASLTEDPKERNSVVMIPRTLSTVGFNIVAVAALPMVHFLGRGNDRMGFFFTALIFSIGMVFFTLITFFVCRENVHVKKKGRMSFKDAVRMVRLNRPLQLVVIGQLLIDVVYAIKGMLPIYYLKYVLDAENMIPLSMGLGMVVMFVGCISAPWFCSKLGKKWATIGGNLMGAVSGIAFYFTDYSINSFFVFGCIGIFGVSMANISLMSMLIDTVEYGEWKTGQRMEGVIFAANTFRAKMSMAIGGALGAYSLAAIKYVPNVTQTAETIKGIHLLFSLVPGVLSILAMLPYFFYDLTEKRYEVILKEVIERRKETE